MSELKPKFKGGYIRRYEEMLASLAYRDLSCVARCLLEEFQRIFRPSRNGYLSISLRNAAKLLKVSEPTVIKAFYELISHGFIVLIKGELWQQRKAREFRLTFEKCNGSMPTDEWKYWAPDNPFPVPQRHKKSRLKKQGQNC